MKCWALVAIEHEQTKQLQNCPRFYWVELDAESAMDAAFAAHPKAHEHTREHLEEVKNTEGMLELDDAGAFCIWRDGQIVVVSGVSKAGCALRYVQEQVAIASQELTQVANRSKRPSKHA